MQIEKIIFFDQIPTCIIQRSTSQFDGSVPYDTNIPDVAQTLKSNILFQAQAAGGLFMLHDTPIMVHHMVVHGGGTFKIYLSLTDAYAADIRKDIQIGTDITGSGIVKVDMALLPGQGIKVVSIGSTNPVACMIARRIMPAAVSA